MSIRRSGRTLRSTAAMFEFRPLSGIRVLDFGCERNEDYPERYKSPREVELDRRTALGLPMNLSFEALCELLDPFYCTYRRSLEHGGVRPSGATRQGEHPARPLDRCGTGGPEPAHGEPYRACLAGGRLDPGGLLVVAVPG